MPDTPLLYFQTGLLIGILFTLLQIVTVLEFKKKCHKLRDSNLYSSVYENSLQRHRDYLMVAIAFSGLMLFCWIHYL